MKINTSKIKKWDFKQRLDEIETRLKKIQEFLDRPANHRDDVEAEDVLHQTMQIVKYWKAHMKGKEDKPKKKSTKPVNLWNS